MSAEAALVVAAVLVASTVQSAVGFGFAIVAAPVLAATAGPQTAAPTLALVGTLVNVLTLAAERRRLDVLMPTAATLVAWSLPGMAGGAAILAYATPDALRALVAVAVLGAVAGYARRGRGTRRGAPRAADSAAVGTLSGFLATSTGLNGPPLVLHLLGRASASQMRDTLAAVFLVTGVLTVGVLSLDGVLGPAPNLAALTAASVAGWALGRLGFASLGHRHEAASLGVLALGAALALVVVAQTVV